MSIIKYATINGWRSRIRLKSDFSLPCSSSSSSSNNSLFPTDSYFSIKLEVFDAAEIKIEEDEIVGHELSRDVSNVDTEMPMNRLQTICKVCQTVKLICCKEMCRTCYKRRLRHTYKNDTSKYVKCQECGEFKAHYAHGICGACYRRKNYKKLRCDKCGLMELRNGRKIKERCRHNIVKKTKKMQRLGANRSKNCKECKKLRAVDKRRSCGECSSHWRECQECEQMKVIHAREMCRPCYYKIFERPKLFDKSKHRKCRSCKKLKSIAVKGLCGACYYRTRYHLDQADTSKHRECRECKKTKLIEAHGMCGACYQRIFRMPKILERRRLIRERKAANLEEHE